MVNEKLCIIAGDNEIMCRIDPELHETCVCEKRLWSGCDEGKEYKGYVYINTEGIKTKEDFDY